MTLIKLIQKTVIFIFFQKNFFQAFGNKKLFLKGIKNDLMKYKKTLEDIEKALESYLETKCEAFPRFYFLSNDDLLDILANVFFFIK